MSTKIDSAIGASFILIGPILLSIMKKMRLSVGLRWLLLFFLPILGMVFCLRLINPRPSGVEWDLWIPVVWFASMFFGWAINLGVEMR